MINYNKPLDKGPAATLNRFLAKLKELENLEISIIEDQQMVSKIGKGLANTYEENGRKYFHRLLKIGKSYRYNVDVVNTMYDKFLKLRNRAKMGSVFYVINPLLEEARV